MKLWIVDYFHVIYGTATTSEIMVAPWSRCKSESGTFFGFSSFNIFWAHLLIDIVAANEDNRRCRSFFFEYHEALCINLMSTHNFQSLIQLDIFRPTLSQLENDENRPIFYSIEIMYLNLSNGTFVLFLSCLDKKRPIKDWA